ncbi:MAG: YdcF family protein [Bizionia sp.]|nr:YdcF family protein [Bizionia sp.]
MKKKIKIIIISAIVCPVILMLVSNYCIEKSARHKTFTEVSNIQNNKVGLVLGTTKRLQNGNINLYFKYRIEATVQLYNSGKIEFVLVSGDNGNKNYDEPTDFKNELIKRGIPENKIFLDYAGFRTLDSVVRAKVIFGQESITFISQKFHNERAIFLAEKNGIKAIGFNARDVSAKAGFKTRIREYFARTKAVIDVIIGVNPKFLGETIDIK